MQYIKRLVGVFLLIFLLYPDESFSSDSSVCDRLSGNDQQPCLDFIKKYPGDYQTEDLKKDSEIYLYNKSNTIFFLDEDTVLPYPITIVRSHRIALFGVKKIDGKKPKLTILEQPEGVPESIILKGFKEAYKYRLTHPGYYRKEIIGSIDQCDSCLISGFSVDRDVQNYNIKIKKMFTIKGNRSVVHLNDLDTAGDMHTEDGYFFAKGISSLVISNFTASSDSALNDKELSSPAIAIEDTPDIKLENISIDHIHVIGFRRAGTFRKIISIINPINFTILNADIVSSGTVESTRPAYVGLFISFANPEKYKSTRVKGVIDQFDFIDFGKKTGRAEGIRFDGTPGHWAGMVMKTYQQVKGSVTVKGLTVNKGTLKANIINLPNLQITGLEAQFVSISQFNNVTSTVPALLIPTLSQYPSTSHTIPLPSISPTATRPVSVTQTVAPTPIDRGAENRKACNRLTKSDKRLCLKFIEKNPDDFEVKSLADNTSISIVNQNNKLFIISGTQHLSHPIMIANCNNIAIFGVNDIKGEQSILRPGKNYKTASYIKENTIGTAFNCNNCIVSGFSFKTWISSKNKYIDRLFNVSGKNTVIHFNNLNIKKEYITSYFDIDGVNSVKISNIAIKYRDDKDDRVYSPAINVVNTNSVDINNFSIINFDPYLNNDAAGLITLVNPVRFRIRNTTFKGSRFSEDTDYGLIMTHIYVRFNDFNKYKHMRVNGQFNNISMTRVDGWPPHWNSITLDGKPESLANLFRGQYKNISGTVRIRNTSLPNFGGKVRKEFLPNLWLDDGTSLPPATTNPTTSLPSATTTKTAAIATTETGAVLPGTTLSKTAIMPTETVAATTPVKQTPALSTYSQTITPTLTTSIISQPFPATSGASQAGMSFTDGKIKPSRATSGVVAKSSHGNSNRTDSETESSDVLSTKAIVGAGVSGAVFLAVATIVISFYCRQKLKAHPEEAGLQMMPR